MMDKKIQWRRVYRQFIAAAAASLAASCGGCIITWISPTLQRLTQQTSLVLATSEKSWVGSIQALASVIGSALAMLLARLYGCRVTLMVIAAVYVCGWAIVAAMRSVAVLLVGRFLLGIAMGGTFCVLPIYTGEVAQAEVRGILSSFFVLFLTCGFLFEYSVGPFVSYLTLALLSGAIPLLLLVSMYFMPDSPYQLVARGKVEDAYAALMWLRNASREDVATELEIIKLSVKARVESQANSSLKHLVTKRGNLKALLLCMALGAIQQMSGSTAMATYTQTIFAASGAGISDTLSTIVNGGFMVLTAIVTCSLIDLFGRRLLTFVSSVGVGSSLVLLGTYFYFKEIGDVSNYGWLPLTCAVGFTIFYGIGWGPIPMTVAAEVFASEVKEKAMFITMSFLNFLGFLYARFFLDISEQIGMAWCFWFFGVCSFLGGIFSFFCLPETKGRSNQEIQLIFHR